MNAAAMNKLYPTLLRRSYALTMGVLLTLGICGCAATDLVEEPGIAPETGKFTLTATLDPGASTRIEHAEGDDGLVKVTWKVGDVIGIQGEHDDEPLPFTCIAVTDGGKTGTFTGDTEPRKASVYGITYPIAMKKVDISTQNQTGNASMAHLGGYDLIATNAADWKNFSFTNNGRYTALMTFDLTGLPADLGTPQSITLGRTGSNPAFYSNLSFASAATLTLGLSNFAAPTGATVDIKAHLMLIGGTKIPEGESLTITVKGSGGSYTFTSPKMTADKRYESGMRYTATVAAEGWTEVRASSSTNSIIACYNTAAVTTPDDYGGGIVGGLNRNIATACYNTGKIARADNSTTNIGAITGDNSSSCTVSYCQWVLDAANTGLPAFPSGAGGTSTENTVRADLAALNADGVTALNAGITAWNTANAADAAVQCAFHFVAGTTAGPTLEAGAPK